MCATPWLAALCPFALGCWICVNWAGKARCAANWRPKLVPPKSTCQEHRIPKALFEHWSIHKWCVCWSFLCWTLATTTSLMRKLWQQVCDVSAGHEPPAIFLGNGTTSHDEPILKWSVYHCVSCICACRFWTSHILGHVRSRDSNWALRQRSQSMRIAFKERATTSQHVLLNVKWIAQPVLPLYLNHNMPGCFLFLGWNLRQRVHDNRNCANKTKKTTKGEIHPREMMRIHLRCRTLQNILGDCGCRWRSGVGNPRPAGE